MRRKLSSFERKRLRREARAEAEALFRGESPVTASIKTDADFVGGAGWEGVGRALRDIGCDHPSVIKGREFELC